MICPPKKHGDFPTIKKHLSTDAHLSWKFQIWNSFVSTLRESKRHRSTCYAGEPQQTDNEQPWHTKQLMMSIIIVIYVTYIILLTSCSWLFRRLFAFLQVLWRLVLGALSNLNLNWFVAACWAPTYCDFEKYNIEKLKVVARPETLISPAVGKNGLHFDYRLQLYKPFQPFS